VIAAGVVVATVADRSVAEIAADRSAAEIAVADGDFS
jgi:hypothetical protein